MSDRDSINGPDWSDPGSVTRWFGGEILQTYSTMSRGQKARADARLRVLANALDSWQRLYKLSAETSELAQLRSEIDELRSLVDDKRGLRTVR